MNELSEVPEELLQKYGVNREQFERARDTAVKIADEHRGKADAIQAVVKEYNISHEAALAAAFIGVLYP